MWYIETFPNPENPHDVWVVIRGRETTSQAMAERIVRGAIRALHHNGHPVEVYHEKERTENESPELPRSTGESGSKSERRRKKGKNPPAE